ncbi:DUF3037 domain-containing protein [uncultured Arcticibacterium sp.]|uniref:DUF3037 domain-containing protein n=1 Tax=uncultured Arcticibacterium sp. TaxID=2173042 RepID=UPI0030F755D8
MKNYQYQLVRYVHDQFTGEFVNLGIVVYSPDDRFLKCKISLSTKRIKGLFPESRSGFIQKQLRDMKQRIKHIAAQQSELFKFSDSLEKITLMVIPPDDSALMFSEVKVALDINFDLALEDLFSELVLRYLPKKDGVRRLNDEEVWKSKYKNFFDKYHVSSKLGKHDIRTDNDVFSFDRAWKNEIWHCYQPVSFDLKESDSVKDKVYKWSGRLTELNKSEEKIHITFLTTISNEHSSLEEFILKSLDQDSDRIEVDVVKEHDADKLARKIRAMMDEHESHKSYN